MLPIKKMLFLPRKLGYYHQKIFLAFDLSAVPPDMQIISMDLYLPHAGGKSSPHVKAIRKIEEQWHPKGIKQGILPRCSSLLKFQYKTEQNRISINLAGFRRKWRKKNNGLCLECNAFTTLPQKHLPYLILSTI